MERLEGFEEMLRQVRQQYEQEGKQLAEWKAAGREKTAAYRQYMGNRLFYSRLLALYRAYGLLSDDEK